MNKNYLAMMRTMFTTFISKFRHKSHKYTSTLD